MKVHANAPLGPKGRLTMVLRVVEQKFVEISGMTHRETLTHVRMREAAGP